MNDKLKEKLKSALRENADSQTAEIKTQTLAKSVFIILCIVFFVILTGTYFLNPYSELGPQGKIKSPPAGSETGKEVRVIGETKNIEPGQYIWLVVDKPEIGLCWPKMSVKPNTKFSTTILEEGPKGDFMLSKYVLNEIIHSQWKEWQDRDMFGGVNMPPKSKRLDSIKLVLKN